MNKKKTLFIVLGIFALVIVTTAASFAFFTYSRTGNTKATIISGDIEFSYIEGKSAELTNAFPVSDEIGAIDETGEYTFQVKLNSSGTTSANYNVYLVDNNTSTNHFTNEQIKFALIKNDVFVANTSATEGVKLSSLDGFNEGTSNGEGIVLKDQEISSGEVDNYKLRIWISDDVSYTNQYLSDGTMEGKYNSYTYSLKVKVTSGVSVVTTFINNISAVNGVITAEIEDETGLSAYAVTNSSLKPNENEWIEITSDTAKSRIVKVSNSLITKKTITHEVDKAGTYYLHVKNIKGSTIKQEVTVSDIISIKNLTVSDVGLIKVTLENTVGLSGYQITTSESEPSSFIELNGVTTKEIEYQADKVGTYYLYVKSTNGEVYKQEVTVSSVTYKEAILNGTDPVLGSALVPVIIDNTGKVTKASLSDEWYDYETKKWANAVILKTTKTYADGQEIPESNIESYFVWIPKYSYKIWDLGNYSSLTSVSNKVQTINIKFGTTNTSDSVSGECKTPGTAGASGNCSVGEYMTHPAFLAFDTNGLWVGKFETGYDGATSYLEAEKDEVNTSKIVVKPNVYSWRSIAIGKMFKNSYDYMRSLDSHMMKNTEWGAIAYLQHSKYGSQQNIRINNNKWYLTGYAAAEEPTVGYNNGTSIEGNRTEATLPGVDGTYTVNYKNTKSQVASTTGNYSGIYDMSGGAWDYVMGYTTGAASGKDLSGITDLYPNFFTNSTYTKYWDKYTSTGTTDTNYNNRILGDAMGEMGSFGAVTEVDGGTRYKSSWYGTYAYFINSTLPWVCRGGQWDNGNSAGVFSYSHYSGMSEENVYYDSFRIVLAPTK